jgi:hypothetical protein
LAGDVGVDTEMLDDWGIQGVRDIIGRLPRKMLHHMAAATSLANDSGATITSDIILGITRTDGNRNRPCRKVSHLVAGRVEDPDDMLYALAVDPVWYPLNGKIYVKPAPTSSYTASISAVSPPTIDASADTTTTGFPDALEGRIVDFMVMKAKQREMGVSRRDAQTEIEAITDSGILGSLSTTYTDIEYSLDAARTEVEKIDEVIVLASDEFDKISALLDLCETDSEGTVNTALGAVTTAIGRVNTAVELANIEFDLMNTDVDTASTSISTTKDTNVGLAELQAADRRAATGDTYLREAQTGVQEAQAYAQEVQSRLTQAQAKREEGGARSKAGASFISEAQARIANAAGYLQEAQSRIGKAQTYLQESGIRLQTAQSYAAQSQAAHAESKTLQEQYVKDIQTYVANHGG